MPEAVHIAQLGPGDADELRSFLNKDPVQNLYALGVLEEHGIGGGEQSEQLAFYGMREGGKLTGAALVGGNGGLVIPCVFDPNGAGELGKFLLGKVKLRGAIGERYAIDALTRAMPGRTRLKKSQRLFAASADDLGPFVCPTLRLASPEDLDTLVAMGLEVAKELAPDEPVSRDAVAARVRARVQAGRTWVLVENGRVLLKIDLGVRSRHGAEIEGVYTDPENRRRGLATNALGQLCRSLLSALPRLTIRVDEKNLGMSALCRKVGFVATRPQKLVLLDDLAAAP